MKIFHNPKNKYLSCCYVNFSSVSRRHWKNMAPPKIITSANGDTVAEALCTEMEAAYSTLEKPSIFIIGLSGGSLPKFFLAAAKQANINWSTVKFIFCDERLVPFNDKESTFGVFKEKVVGEIEGVSENSFVTVDVSLPPEKAAEDYEAKLKSLSCPTTEDGFPRFDVLLLGMGPDGHTCSLFPNHPLLEEKTKIVAPITDSPKPPPERVTLTYPVLNNAKNIIFVSTGDGKKDVIEKILKHQDNTFPATRVSPVNGNLIWILDEAAASKL